MQRNHVSERYICVYCGSSMGANPYYQSQAQDFAKDLARSGIGLVYGGGDLGLMGILAQHVLEHGGKVIGIIPDFLCRKEIMSLNVSEVIVTADMHERKKLMFEKSDGFVALPGGIGTLEELVEQLTWSQLGQHNKPICLANFEGFWNPLLNLIAHMKKEHFIRPNLDFSLHVIDKAEDIMPKMIQLMDKAQPYQSDDSVLEKL